MIEQTVYLVTQGEYSDRHVLAVFSTEEKAQKFIEMCNEKYDSARKNAEDYYLTNCWIWAVNSKIESFELDALADGPRQGLFSYEVWMDMNGDVREVELKLGTPSNRHEIHNDTMTLWVQARDEQHAVKIANERRAQWIALGLPNTTADENEEEE